MLNALCALCENPVYDVPPNHPPVIVCDQCQEEFTKVLFNETMTVLQLQNQLTIRARQIGALNRGDYTLKNGRRTDTYFDGRMLSMDPYGATLIGRLILPIVRTNGANAIGGPAISAIPIATAVAIRSITEITQPPGPEPIPAFTIREERKPHGLQKVIDGPLPPSSSVALVDDTMTTGKSIIDAMDTLTNEGHTIRTIVVLLDRQEDTEQARLIRDHSHMFTPILDTRTIWT